MPRYQKFLLTTLMLTVFGVVSPIAAQERLPWDPPSQGQSRDGTQDPYSPGTRYEPQGGQGDGDYVERSDDNRTYDNRSYDERRYDDRRASRSDGQRYDEREYDDRRDRDQSYDDRETYSSNEIVDAGHHFFGAVSRGLADAIAYVFRSQGRPNGYILGEDAGGAFVAGLRYGEGRLYTKRWGDRKVYWQGPSLGYDFGGEGSKVMVLVYDLEHPSDIYRRFGGVQGSAYLVGGVGVELQKRAHVTLAPIRAGVGLRFGANVGYLKYTRRPTWNPF